MDDYVDYLAEVLRLGNPSFESIFLTTGTVAVICGFLLREIPVSTLVTQQTIDLSVATVN